jgi:hypothetical protein
MVSFRFRVFFSSFPVRTASVWVLCGMHSTFDGHVGTRRETQKYENEKKCNENTSGIRTRMSFNAPGASMMMI